MAEEASAACQARAVGVHLMGVSGGVASFQRVAALVDLHVIFIKNRSYHSYGCGVEVGRNGQAWVVGRRVPQGRVLS